MKKARSGLGLIVLLMLALLVLTGCGKKTANEKQLLDDLNGSEAYLPAYKNVRFTKLKVEKRKTDENAKLDQVYVIVSGENEDANCEAAYEMDYTLYNEGWQLDSVVEWNYETWKAITKEGVPEERLLSIMEERLRDGMFPTGVADEDMIIYAEDNYVPYDQVIQTSNTEELSEGRAVYTYDVITNYTYMTSTDHIRIKCKMEPSNLEWNIRCSRLGRDRDWSKICGYWSGNRSSGDIFGPRGEFEVWVNSYDDVIFSGEYKLKVSFRTPVNGNMEEVEKVEENVFSYEPSRSGYYDDYSSDGEFYTFSDDHNSNYKKTVAFGWALTETRA